MAIKIIIGVVVIAAFIFIILNFILPLFKKGSSGKAELTYWGLWEDSNVMQPIIEDFKKQNPNITVNYIKQDVKQYRQKLSTRMKNSTGPDIFAFHNTWIPMVSEFLLPLPDNTITKNEFKNSFYEVNEKDLIKNGAIYGIPIGIDTLALYINSDIFKAAGLSPPNNWEDFGKIARSLTVVDETGRIKTSGAALGAYDNITHASDIVSLLLIQNGADIKNMSSTSVNASDALQFYTSFAIGDQKVWDSTLDPSILAFSKGNLAMYFGYSWDYFAIKAMNPELAFEIYQVPHLTGVNTTVASYWAVGASAKSKYQKETLLFLKFLAKAETMEKLFTLASKTRAFGEPYARKDLAQKLNDNPIVYPFISQAKDTQSSFFASDTYDDGLNSQMNAYLGNAVRSIISNNTSAESAVTTLAQGVSQVLKQYGQ
ncbi:MAG: extracellular solute-binding protein [Candidatus Levybacteria bacterium]|nr:extracellular solute-binding protein [Candidatus Levybacteria bacterium]